MRPAAAGLGRRRGRRRLRLARGRPDARVRPRARRSSRRCASTRRSSRPNLFVKIPATKPGLGAIEDCIARGNSINVTLIFSLERYAEVAEAYLSGLERLVAAGGDPSEVASVASFFVSRVDTEADRRLEELGGRRELAGQARDREREARLPALPGGVLRRALGVPRRQGRAPQRCLWASTSTKNPAYRDVLYVEELIGPDTVNTMPPETIARLPGSRRGRADTLTEGVDEAEQLLDELARGGRRLRRRRRDARGGGRAEVRRLVRELLDGIRAKRGGARRGVTRMSSIVERIWGDDASLWTGARRGRWLGWLDVADADAAARRGARRRSPRPPSSSSTTSSCSAWAARPSRRRCCGATFEVESFHVLDTTHPAAIRRLEASSTSSARSSSSPPSRARRSRRARTSTTSGSASGGRGEQFAAITDPGSELERLASERGFRAIFPGEPRSAAATRRSRCSGSCPRR